MKLYLIIFLLVLCINLQSAFGQDEVEIVEESSEIEEEVSETEVNFSLSSSFGMTFQSLSQSEEEEIEELQWLLNIQSALNVNAELAADKVTPILTIKVDGDIISGSLKMKHDSTSNSIRNMK